MSEPYEMRFHHCQNTVTLLREELLQTKAALRRLVEAASPKQWDGVAHRAGKRERYCSGCFAWSWSDHLSDCDYAAAIAAAERLLGPTSGP